MSDGDEERPDHANERPYHNIPLTLNDVADAIGVPPGELRQWLAQGQGLGDIMREQGKDIEKAVATLLEMMKERLPVLVERGELSGEEARFILAELKERLMSDLSEHERVRPRPKTDRPIAYVPFDLEKVARTLDLTAQELRRLLSPRSDSSADRF